MMFNMIAWWSVKNNQMPTISMIQLFSNYGEDLPSNLPDNDFTIMNNSCDFVTYSCGVYNSWAMKNPNELPKFIALHEKFYAEWKVTNPGASYQKFSESMENWVKTSSPYDFVTPSQINTCNELKKSGKLVFDETALADNTRMYVTKTFRILLNRSPRSEELNYFIRNVEIKELSLNDLLFLLLTSEEYIGGSL
jgi:hypothetical protein